MPRTSDPPPSAIESRARRSVEWFTPKPLGPGQTARIRADHQPADERYRWGPRQRKSGMLPLCRMCRQQWPCDAVRLLATIEADRQSIDKDGIVTDVKEFRVEWPADRLDQLEPGKFIVLGGVANKYRVLRNDIAARKVGGYESPVTQVRGTPDKSGNVYPFDWVLVTVEVEYVP